MLIDWFTIVAQLINFLILVVALKYLLYDRLMGVMEKRRRAIAEKEEQAEERTEEAEEELQQLRQDRRNLEKRREGMLEEARRDASQRRRELLKEAREEVDRQEEEWRESIRSRQERLLGDMQRLTGEKAVALTRRLLSDMADQTMEETLIRSLVERIGSIPEEERSGIAESVRSSDSPILVRSAFQPSDAGRQNVDKALRELVGDLERSITWQEDPGLITGVVVQVGPRTVGWSMSGYLDEVEREFADLLRSEVGTSRSRADRNEEEP